MGTPPPFPAPDLGGSRQLGGCECRRWRVADWATFEEWVRDCREAEARKSLAKSDLSPRDREDLVAELRARPLPTWEVYQHVATREGWLFALKLGFRQAHPLITYAEIEDIRMQLGTVADLTRWLLGLDAIVPPKGKEGQSQSPPPVPPIPPTS